MNTIQPMAVQPLMWPGHLARTKHPAPAAFQTTGAKAYVHLVDEVRRLGGTRLIVSSNLAVSRAGNPLFGSSRANLADSGVAVYFVREGDDLCIACDAWTTVDDNLRAIGKTIESLRGIERWGTREMVDAAFRGYAALPGPVAAPAGPPWWEVLGVAPGAPRADIDAAYRALLKQHHPDVGGDAESFHQLQMAYQAATAIS